MRSSKIVSLLCLTAISTLAGCAAAPRVQSVGENLYHVRATGSPLDSQSNTNYRAFLAAHSYCEGQDKQVLFRQSQESGAHSYSPKREDLTFTCMSAANPGYLNAGLRRDGMQAREPVFAQQNR